MKFFLFLALTLLPRFGHAASDPLTRAAIAVPGPHGDATLARAVADLKGIFQHFAPGLDSSTTIVKPLVVSGTADHPVVKVSLRKCVAFVCQTVDFDATSEIREVAGPCAHNYALVSDLSRSSAALSDVYDRLDVAACYKANADGSGSLAFDASAHQAPRYSQGLIQREIVKMLMLQVGPITKAIQDSLKAKNAD